jgi:hypothetical protein
MQTSTDSKPRHDSPKLTSFITLRANGWSLASISLEINVPKSTLWEWDTKHQDQIRRLKQVQLEKFQERFLSTYEDELARLSFYLITIEAALKKCRFDDMSPAFLLQTALYLRSRLACLRVKPSDANAPSPIGRITSHPYDQFTDDDLRDALQAAPPVTTASSSPSPPVGSPNPEPQPNNPEPASQKPDETPGGTPNGSLIINGLQQHIEHARPVLHSQNEAASQHHHTPKPRPKAGPGSIDG